MLQHSYAEVNKVKLHYVSAGQGQLMLFLHGYPEFWYEWKNQLEVFSKEYYAVAPDMRGYNLSSKPQDVSQYEVKYLVEDIISLVEHLNYKKLILVGHDWGGIVAWFFAAKYSQYLSKLILINSPHPIIFEKELKFNPEQQKASQYMLFLRQPQAEKIIANNNYERFFEDRIFGNLIKKSIFTKEDKSAYIRAWSQPDALKSALNYYRATKVGQPSENISDSGIFGIDISNIIIKVPTLVIWGEQDVFLLKNNLHGLDQFVENLTIKTIPNGTHWVLHEKSQIVNGYIKDFCSK